MSKTQRKWFTLLAVAGSGVLFQVPAYPSNCAQYYATGILSALDFCSIVNCTGGSFFNFCSPTQIFLDCPTTATP